MRKVQILLSTYNGEKYLNQLLDSLINQTYKNIEILIRDDCSTDSTIEIIKKYSKEFSNINYYTGENLGACKSFFDLVINSSNSSSYYAFADQDDIWDRDKVEVAVKKIEKFEYKPALYCSNLNISDSNMKITKVNGFKDKVVPSLENALIENICVGCTSLFNKHLRDIVKDSTEADIYMHDWWLYLLGVHFGEVIYDNTAHISYRIHELNTVGMSNDVFSKFIRRCKNYFTMRDNVIQQSKEFINYTGISDNQLYLSKIISKNKNISDVFKMLTDKNVYRHSRIETIIYKILMAFW